MPYVFKSSGWAWALVLGAAEIFGGFYIEPKKLVGTLKFEVIVVSVDEGFGTLRLFRGDELIGLFAGPFVGDGAGYLSGEGEFSSTETKKK